jgi:hypothetical protein
LKKIYYLVKIFFIKDIKQFNQEFDENKLNFGKDEPTKNKGNYSQKLFRSESKDTTIEKKKLNNTAEKFYSKSLYKEKFSNFKSLPQNNCKSNRVFDCINNPKNPYSTSWGNKILLTRFKVKLAYDGFTNGLPNLKLVKANKGKKIIAENNSNLMMSMSKTNHNKEELMNVH